MSQLGDFSIDQMKFACWAQEVRITSLQRCYSISDVERALQLLQPTVASRLSLFYYLFLWILTGYSFQKSFSSGHEGLDYNILLSFVGFVEYLGGGMLFITVYYMLCILKTYNTR